MAGAVVGFLLSNLKELLEKEAELQLGVNRELESLSVQLEFMQSFLRNCHGVPEKHEAVKQLVKQIRDLAYNAEDVIDDYVVCVHEARKRIEDAEGKVYLRKKRKGWQKFLPKLEKIAKKHNVSGRILDIERRTNAIYANNQRFGVEINRAIEEAARGVKARRHCRKAPIVEEIYVVGFTEQVRTLVERLTGGDKKRTVISIVGMGGLGKTTLAKRIYHHDSIARFDHRAWVYVSQENTTTELMFAILKSVSKATQVTEDMKEMNEEDFGSILSNRLKEKKYLIVMDDVWKSQVWEDLDSVFPDDNNGSRIVTTTRKKDVALDVDSDPTNPPFYLNFLGKEDSWLLFKKKAFRGETITPQWEVRGREVAEKCGGLPLAIVVMAGLLKKKEDARFHDWSKVVSRVSSCLSQTPDFKDILALSYNELPYYLKPCFLYFSLFTKGYEIPARQLIQLWVSEGFIEGNPPETMEDTAENYLENLVDRSLIQVVKRGLDGRVKICSIHDLLCDLSILESQEENFLHVHPLENSPPPVKPRRLSGNAQTIRYINANPHTIRKLRSLFCLTSSGTIAWDNLLKTMRFLRVLKVSELTNLPPEVENLILLRYLWLDRNSMVQTPSSICYLPNLQVLDARCRSMNTVPAGIWKLKKLRHVYFQGATVLPQPPTLLASSFRDDGPADDDDEMSLLKHLQTLSTVSASSCTSQVFFEVPNLQKLGVKGDLNDLPEDLERLKKLYTLKLERVGDFPQLISLPLKFPPNLIKLTLCDTQLKKDPMPLLGKLPNLEILKLMSNAYTGRKMICQENGFPQLQVLKLVNSQEIREAKMKEGSLPHLKHIMINDCSVLKWLTGMNFLTTLKVVDIKKPTTELRQAMQQLNEQSKFQLDIFPIQKDQ